MSVTFVVVQLLLGAYWALRWDDSIILA